MTGQTEYTIVQRSWKHGYPVKQITQKSAWELQDNLKKCLTHVLQQNWKSGRGNLFSAGSVKHTARSGRPRRRR